jgi:hypothetical protein
MYSLVSDSRRRSARGGHRIVYWAFTPTFDLFDKKWEIDHWDQCRANNSLENLNQMLKPDHIQKTMADNPGMFSVKGLKTRSTPMKHTDPVTRVVAEYTSLAEAIEKTDLQGRRITSMVKHRQQGWALMQEEQAGEEWYRFGTDSLEYLSSKYNKTFKGVEVSNLGRIRVGLRASKGSMNEQGRYMSGGVQVSHLVCTAWDGPPPNARMNVLHLNGDMGDNHPENLVWSAGNNKRIPADAWAVPSLVVNRIVSSTEQQKVHAAEIVSTILTDEQRGTLMMNTSPEDRPETECVCVPLETVIDSVRSFQMGHDDEELAEFRSMFKLKTGVSEFELLQTVMKAAFGVSVARKHRCPRRTAYNTIQFSNQWLMKKQAKVRIKDGITQRQLAEKALDASPPVQAQFPDLQVHAE